jgi:putative peptidoglycan lipid II flippase
MIIKNTIIIALFTILSQALGVLRDKLLVTMIGIGVTLDIYNASFKIPDLLMAILVSFVGLTVVVPYFTTSVIKNDDLELNKKFSTLLMFFSAMIVILSVIIILTLDLFLGYMFPVFNAADLTSLSYMTKLLLIQPILIGISNLFACYAQTYKNFIYYAIAPIFYNLGIIFGIVFLYEKYKLSGLVYGVIAGAIMHISINTIFIIKKKVQVKLEYFDLKYIKQILPVVGNRSIAFISIALRQFSLTIVAGLLGAGIITAWTFALNLVNMCVQFFATSFAIASFPTLSEYYEKREFAILESTIKKNVRDIFLYSIIFSAIMFFFATAVVKIIYNGNQSVLNLFYILIFTIPFLNLEQYYARALMAINQSKLISHVFIATPILLIGLLYIFYISNLSYTLIAYAYLISVIVEVIALYILGQRTFRKLHD